MFESAMKPVWWLPTFGFFLFLAIELWMFANPDLIFEDPGVGRHLRTAEFILETGQIPRTDPLSFTKAGQPWIDFEWAFEATLGELYRAGDCRLFARFATRFLRPRSWEFTGRCFSQACRFRSCCSPPPSPF